MVEELLRETMAEQADAIDSAPDLTAAAVRRGGRRRTLRRVGTPVAAVIAVLAVAGGILVGGNLLSQRKPEPPAARPADAAPLVPRLRDNVLTVPGGRKIPLPQTGVAVYATLSEVVSAVRGGWLVRGSTRVLFVSAAGAVRKLAEVPDGFDGPVLVAVPSPDGDRVAITKAEAAGQTWVVDLGTQREVARTPTPDAYVDNWYGNQVVLRFQDHKLSLWDPSRGAWDRRRSSKSVTLVSGGNLLLGYNQAANGTYCLGPVDPLHDFAIGATNCAVVFGEDDMTVFVPSPAGRHLVALTSGAVSGSYTPPYVLSVTANGVATGTRLTLSGGHFPTTAAWEDDRTVIVFMTYDEGQPEPAPQRCWIDTGKCVPTRN